MPNSANLSVRSMLQLQYNHHSPLLSQRCKRVANARQTTFRQICTATLAFAHTKSIYGHYLLFHYRSQLHYTVVNLHKCSTEMPYVSKGELHLPPCCIAVTRRSTEGVKQVGLVLFVILSRVVLCTLPQVQKHVPIIFRNSALP
jgi:hypothetical protein